MKTTQNKNQNGFTLIEIMLASAISFIAFMSISSLAISSYGFKSDLENQQSAATNSQSLQSILADVNTCSLNLNKPPGIIYDQSLNPNLFTTGVPIEVSKLDSSLLLTTEKIIGSGVKLGNLIVDKAVLIHTQHIDQSRAIAKILITYRIPGNAMAVMSEVPVIVELNPYDFNKVSKCFGGDILSSLGKADPGQAVCDQMQSLFGEAGTIYNPVTQECEPIPRETIQHDDGQRNTAYCPASHPYYASNYGCGANVSGDTCPPGETCVLNWGPGSSEAANHRCFRIDPMDGREGVGCEYALGVDPGAICYLYCTNYRE